MDRVVAHLAVAATAGGAGLRLDHRAVRRAPSGARLHSAPVRGVFTTAEKLFPQQREVIEAVFGCRVFDCYGSSEVQNIATECPRGRMHINADYVVVETDGRERAGDGSAPLLVTSLRNYAMPFLRYRNEDHGALVDGTATAAAASRS
jgi:phenylacetate-CoA ligase